MLRKKMVDGFVVVERVLTKEPTSELVYLGVRQTTKRLKYWEDLRKMRDSDHYCEIHKIQLNDAEEFIENQLKRHNVLHVTKWCATLQEAIQISRNDPFCGLPT